MKKILITTSSFDVSNLHHKNILHESGFEFVINPYKRRLSEEEVSLLLTKDIVGMIAGVEPLTRNVLTSAKSLKVISRCGIGLDNVDLNAASDLGIRVCNTPDAPTQAVVELTIALILNLLRNISNSNRQIREKSWKPQMGTLLAGKCVGIIGFGRIGRGVAQLMAAFGAKVFVYDTVQLVSSLNVYPMSLEALLSESDIVSLHVPITQENYHLIGEEQIHCMKPTAYLINTSRGGLIDEQALYHALLENRLAGAGLDVFEQEPYRGPLCDLSNVIMTAHMGSYARECRIKQEKEAAINLVDALTELNLLHK